MEWVLEWRKAEVDKNEAVFLLFNNSPFVVAVFLIRSDPRGIVQLSFPINLN
jgi:hypothetical protein